MNRNWKISNNTFDQAIMPACCSFQRPKQNQQLPAVIDAVFISTSKRPLVSESYLRTLYCDLKRQTYIGRLKRMRHHDFRFQSAVIVQRPLLNGQLHSLFRLESLDASFLGERILFSLNPIVSFAKWLTHGPAVRHRYNIKIYLRLHGV